MLNLGLDDKVAIVTGAGQGIGRSIALALAREGVHIAIDDIRPDTAQSVADEVRSIGRRALAIIGDVSDVNQVQHMVTVALEELGRIDILVNNAGVVSEDLLFHLTSPADWKRELQVDLIGVLNCCRFVVPHMVERRYGKIVNITSTAGRLGVSGSAIYCAAKAGVIGFARALAVELAKHNINVNSVAPTSTQTPMLDNVSKDVLESILKTIPKSRVAQPEEVANMVLYLCSDLASFITGQCISVCGGRTML